MPRKAKGSTTETKVEEHVEEQITTVVKRSTRVPKKVEAAATEAAIATEMTNVTKGKGRVTKQTAKGPPAQPEPPADPTTAEDESDDPAASRNKKGRGKVTKSTDLPAEMTEAAVTSGKAKGKIRPKASSAVPSEAEASAPVAKKRKVESDDVDIDGKPAKAAKGEKTPVEKVLIEKTEIKRVVPDKRSFKVISWNVTTLRSLVNKNSEILKKLVSTEKPDLLCLQEIKLNPSDQDEYEQKLKALLPPCTLHWNFCTVEDSKSYAGSLAIVFGQAEGGLKTIDKFFSSNKEGAKSEGGHLTPINVSMDLPTLKDLDDPVAKDAQREGRTITVEYENFFVVVCYVPNSGDKLQRLDFRTQTWDPKLGEYLVQLEGRKPVIFCGDLNVAHLDEDIWNVGAKHLTKTPGTTKEERAGFGKLLSLGFVDAFRMLHPDASGWFTYWSVRAGNLAFNRGLRLDYFVTSPKLFSHDAAAAGAADAAAATRPVIRDAAILSDFIAVDHAAVALTLEL